MIDWQTNKRILIEASEPVVRAFRSRYRKNEVCAIGYVFEFGNASPQFALCAETRHHRDSFRAEWPDSEFASDRWNSGNYEYPAGLGTARDELGTEWKTVSTCLHKLSLQDKHFQEVYSGTIRICCDALVELARRRAFGDLNDLDFNVAETLDDVSVVKQRHELIRAAIENNYIK